MSDYQLRMNVNSERTEFVVRKGNINNDCLYAILYHKRM